MNILRKVSYLVVIAMLLTTVSCVSVNLPPKKGEESAAPENETKPAPEYDYDIVDNNFIHDIDRYMNILGKADFAGTAFMVATPTPSLIDEDTFGASRSQTLEFRNRYIEDAYNVDIISKTVSPDAMYDSVYHSQTTGEFFADLLMIPQYYVHLYASNGLLMNLNSLPFADFTSGFNIESGVEAGTGLSEGWALGGWATLDPDGLPAVFFNKQLAEATGLDDPYDLVESGEWTWDKFLEFTTSMPAVNDARLAGGTPAAYSWGAQTTSSYVADLIFFSEGNRFTSSGIGAYPTIAFTAEGAAHSSYVSRSLYDDNLKVFNYLEATDRFSSGQCLFLIDRLGTMKIISNSSAVWGVLPLPKLSADQEKYISPAPSDTLMFAVPANTTGVEKTSRIMSAMNACSLGCMVDSYVTDSMYYYLRDNRSTHSVEKICCGVVYDAAYTAGGYDDAISNCTYLAVRNVFENGQDLGSILDVYSQGAEAALSRFFS